MGSATQRQKYIQRAHEARQATVANMAAVGVVGFELGEWSGRTFAALAEWPSTRFDWSKIRDAYGREPDRFDVAIWSGERLAGLFLATLAGESVTLRFVEADPREDCPLVGRRLLIALDASVNYTQINGKYELRVEPINGKLINLFETDFGFKPVILEKVLHIGRSRCEMTAVARLKHGLGNAMRLLSHKPLPAPERTFGKPRTMTGFLDTLDDQQKKRVLGCAGPENVGDEKFAK